MKKAFRKQEVVVFGGSGFLGSHVADALTAAGYRVKIFDLKPSPYLQKGQEMILGDILKPSDIRKAVKGCRYIYNFAGIADLDDAAVKPVDTVQLNIIGNINILNAAVEAKIERYVYASTIYVYSEKGGFYRCSKQASELFIEEYQRRFGLDFTILRYGTLYGPRADDRNSIHRYLKQALQSGTITCFGSTEGIRDYVHVRDAANLSVEVLEEKYRNMHVIISGLHPIKFREMILMIKEILGRPVRVISKGKSAAHYEYVPYSFNPKIGCKLTSRLYLDMGQGLLECLQEIHEQKGVK